MRKDVADIDHRATVEEARLALEHVDAEALCVHAPVQVTPRQVIGVITQPDIDNHREAI